jgi:energy-coupling factor transport system ATP-binding protein
MMQLFNGIAAPSEGRVLLDGYNINMTPEEALSDESIFPEFRALSKHKRRKAIKNEIKQRKSRLCFRVGLVMQYPEYQLFEDTVVEDIAFGPKNMGLEKDEIDKRVREAAELVGLDGELLSKSPFDLSGGQKRRAAIAGVMAMRPEVLVLDEPAAGLDPAGRNSIFDGIKRYAEATGAAVIIVSHSMDDMAKYCEELVVLSKSKVAMSGNRKEVFSRCDELESIGLGVPQITRLVMLLRDRGVEISPDIYTVDEAERALAELFGGVR